MLFSDKYDTIEGLEIYQDFSDPRRFYYLPPAAPRIALSAEGTGAYALSLVVYRRDIESGPLPQGVQDGGGFLAVDVDLRVPPGKLDRVREELQGRVSGASITSVPYTDGAVSLTLLGVSSADEAGGAFVTRIAGSTRPALYGDNRAAFSVTLDKEGAALMDALVRGGGSTQAIVQYDLKFAGIAPAYNLHIVIEYGRVFESMRIQAGLSAGLSTGGMSFLARAGFDSLLEKLQDDGSILVEETDFVPGEGGRSPASQQAINDIIADLMGSKWFKQTLAAGPQLPAAPTAPAAGPMVSTGAPGGTQRPAGDTSLQVAFSFDMSIVEREEHIRREYTLNTRKARLHEIHPVGQLMVDLPSGEADRYITYADLRHPFFTKLHLDLATTAEWEKDGIDSIVVQVRYGPEGAGVFTHTPSMRLTKDAPAASWETHTLRDHANDPHQPLVLWYDYRVTVHFLADVAIGDQAGSAISVGVPGADPEGWIHTTERHLVLNPRDVTPIIPVEVSAGVVDFDVVDEVHATLRFGPYEQIVRLNREVSQARYIVRPEPGLEDARLTTEGQLFYKDGARVPVPHQDWGRQRLVILNEPRENILRVRVIMVDPGHLYEKILVRLGYTDAARSVVKDLELTAHAQIIDWEVRLEDPNRRTWTHEVTKMRKDGGIEASPSTETDGTRLVVGVPARDIISVEVTWLGTIGGDLRALRVEMDYDDERNDVHWDHTELMMEGHVGKFSWAIPIEDVERRSYRYRLTFFRTTEAPVPGEWIETDTRSLVLI